MICQGQVSTRPRTDCPSTLQKRGMVTENLRNQPNFSLSHQLAGNFIHRENVIEITRISENNCVLLETLAIIFYVENILSFW